MSDFKIIKNPTTKEIMDEIEEAVIVEEKKKTKKAPPKKTTTKEKEEVKKDPPKKRGRPKKTDPPREKKQQKPPKPNKYELYIEPRLHEISKWKFEGKTNTQIAIMLGLSNSEFSRQIHKNEELKKAIDEHRKKLELSLELGFLEVLKRGYHVDEELITNADGSKILQRKVKRRAVSAGDIEFGLKLINYSKWVKGEIEKTGKEGLPVFGGGEDDL